MELINIKGIDFEEIEIISKDYTELFTVDVEVEKSHHYILESGIISHNTVSLMTQTTSGIEPVFLPIYERRRKVEKNEPHTFVDSTGDCFVSYNVIHHKLVEWFKIQYNKDLNVIDTPPLTYTEALNILKNMKYAELKKLVAESPYAGATTNDVNWVEKVNMQGLLQEYVDHSISVTVNLPNSASVELVSEVYKTAWKSGCKGCTIYRDGSRDGILIPKTDKDSLKTNILQSGTRSKRKPVLPCVVDVISARGYKFAIFVGIDDGMPYEVFAFKITPEELKLFKSIKHTTITKLAKKRYCLGSEFAGVSGADDILSRFGSEEEQAITRMASTMMRYKIPLIEIIDQIIKSSTSLDKFSKAMAISLQKFLSNDLTLYEKCGNCGGKMVSYDGCKRCADCGQSKCG